MGSSQTAFFFWFPILLVIFHIFHNRYRLGGLLESYCQRCSLKDDDIKRAVVRERLPGSSGAPRGHPIKKLRKKWKKVVENKGQWSWSEFPRPPGNSGATPGIPRNSFQTGPKRFPDSSQKFPRKAHRQLQDDSQRAAGRLPERSGKILGQFSGSPVFLYFAILFHFLKYFL